MSVKIMSIENSEESSSLLDLREELVKDEISARLKLIILASTPEKRRFPILETMTGVAESTWRTWWRRGGVPSGALIEGASKSWPQYAFWLATGITDNEYGHRMPKLHNAVLGYVNHWPDSALVKPRIYGEEYFKLCLEMRAKDNGNHREKLKILENTLTFIRNARYEEIAKGVAREGSTGDEKGYLRQHGSGL